MTVDSALRKTLSNAYPQCDFTPYFCFIESLPSAPSSGEKHHILPRHDFPNLVKDPTNIVQLAYTDHFRAHYWLAVCAPDCVAFQRALFFMANHCKYSSLSKDDLPKFAEAYAIARDTHRKNLIASWTTGKRAKQSTVAIRVNKKENAKLQDFTCPDCKQEFKQITRGIYGGHRRFCLHHAGTDIAPRPLVIPTEETTKRCGKCQTDKLLVEFNVERKSRLGRANWCRLCTHLHRKDKIMPGLNPLHDYTCPSCGKEFKQVKPGVFGGHRRSCLNWGSRKKELLEWGGTLQEFAEYHNLPLTTVYRWRDEIDLGLTL